MSECVCGFNPPDECNPDCERCRLVSDRAALLAACEATLNQLDYLRGLWGDEGVTRSLCDQIRAAIAKAKGGNP